MAGHEGSTRAVIAALLANAAIAISKFVVFFITVIEAFVRKRPAEANPWGEGATTLEWTLSSPPPVHQYEVLPRIA